eukprot:TRINITY_DN15708_c0_g1_i1.p1 TRINITY_DN15708_c0_g1~~TRINITY_DN15708_c0_g1_i1.p1  ORF type:complete len:352 (+),score=89.15 TRINITY_DN15708_c0_g1_i1:141-1058(+)
MITPFKEDNTIDWDNVDRLVEWYIKAGIAGIFTVCLSSEMYDLSDDERLQLATRVVKIVNGRVAVVAGGTFGGSIRDMANFTHRIYNTGVDAVVVITCQMAKENDTEDVWKLNVKEYLDATGNIPLGLYECPKPHLRLLSPECLKWAVESDRFRFHKDVSCSVPLIKKKLDALNSISSPNSKKFKFYNANMATLSASVALGGDGFCGIAANLYPELITWMLKKQKGSDADKKEGDVMQRFLTISESIVANKYPQCAKMYLQTQVPGFESFTTKCRVMDVTFNEEETLRLQHMAEYIQGLKTQMNI